MRGGPTCITRCGVPNLQGRPFATRGDANPFEKLIRHYGQHYRGRVLAEENWFRGQPTLQDAIRRSAMAHGPGGRKLPHQWRLRNSDLRRAEDALLAKERIISRCSTFDQLHTVIARAVRDIWRNAELYVYDMSMRIGAKLGLKPDKVFLHRGTRAGARRLGLKTSAPTLDISDLPPGLRGIEPCEVEDMLCIYKDHL